MHPDEFLRNLLGARRSMYLKLKLLVSIKRMTIPGYAMSYEEMIKLSQLKAYEYIDVDDY